MLIITISNKNLSPLRKRLPINGLELNTASFKCFISTNRLYAITNDSLTIITKFSFISEETCTSPYMSSFCSTQTCLILSPNFPQCQTLSHTYLSLSIYLDSQLSFAFFLNLYFYFLRLNIVFLIIYLDLSSILLLLLVHPSFNLPFIINLLCQPPTFLCNHFLTLSIFPYLSLIIYSISVLVFLLQSLFLNYLSVLASQFLLSLIFLFR